MVKSKYLKINYPHRDTEIGIQRYDCYACRKGHGKAVVAVVHEMLRIVYFMLKRMEPYRDENRRLTVIKVKKLERKANVSLHAP